MWSSESRVKPANGVRLTRPLRKNDERKIPASGNLLLPDSRALRFPLLRFFPSLFLYFRFLLSAHSSPQAHTTLSKMVKSYETQEDELFQQQVKQVEQWFKVSPPLGLAHTLLL